MLVKKIIIKSWTQSPILWLPKYEIGVKVDSVKEACAKYFVVHILKFEMLQATWKKQNKKHQNAKFIGIKLKAKGLISLFHFFHRICKISNLDK